MTANVEPFGGQMDLPEPEVAVEHNEPAIVINDVSKRFKLYNERANTLKEMITKFRFARYEDFWALRNISLTINKGEVYGLIGHNGSGKSSLLRIMAGVHRPTSGTIETTGRISALLELGAGFHPELTGRENVYLNAAILGIKRKECDKIFDEVVEFSGLSEFIDSPVKHYSSGMFVRLGFSVAVHVDPQILIIDEVIAVGDEEFQRRCFEHLHKLKSRGVTIVMVTHSLNIVQSMCDRAAWFDHGELQVEGKATDVVFKYLEQVNDAEAERLDEEALDAHRRRQEGDEVETSVRARRPIVIDRVEFLDRDGTEIVTCSPRDPLTVRIHYTCNEPVAEPLFSFAVESADGVYAANPGMRVKHTDVATFTGSGYVDYVIDHVPLGPGQFEFTFAIHDTDGMILFDKRERLATLRVQPGEFMVVGLVDLTGTWQPLEGSTTEGT